MTRNDTVCQLNDFLKELKSEYSKAVASQAKRIMFLLDERNFIPGLSLYVNVNVLKTVFDILVNNAIKHTGKGYIKVGYHILENTLIQFFVEDTGNGFEPAILKELIDNFAADSNVADETAASLAGANQLITAIGGKIRIDSHQGMGTTVYFSMDYKPLNAGVATEEKSSVNATQTYTEASAQSARGNAVNNIWAGKTILIAEDEIVNYMFLEVLFEETGAILLHAADGRQAIDAVKSNPNINVVLMDIKMPNINGLDATRQIKAIRPQLPVIAQTAYAMQDDEYKALQAGCNDYISKPIDANKLTNIMKKYI